MRVISKSEFLDLYEQDKIRLDTLISTSIAIVAKTKPAKDYKSEVVVVNIP